ncbi:hypothetical protein [Paenibacillus sp.]
MNQLPNKYVSRRNPGSDGKIQQFGNQLWGRTQSLFLAFVATGAFVDSRMYAGENKK